MMTRHDHTYLIFAAAALIALALAGCDTKLTVDVTLKRGDPLPVEIVAVPVATDAPTTATETPNAAATRIYNKLSDGPYKPPQPPPATPIPLTNAEMDALRSDHPLPDDPWIRPDGTMRRQGAGITEGMEP
jgi:hypothetical protein